MIIQIDVSLVTVAEDVGSGLGALFDPLKEFALSGKIWTRQRLRPRGLAQLG